MEVWLSVDGRCRSAIVAGKLAILWASARLAWVIRRRVSVDMTAKYLRVLPT
ncbi:hypothetical protein [Lapidilactobacillus wuchangensis]|uniref:hypothetical protein n=1 Tax=Lapidilactobacillus wuchangensis TaxID=2486001 RepID=UPI0013DE0849|nr:hypothetical protein [Lapidilactobacillus wuchangensis]